MQTKVLSLRLQPQELAAAQRVAAAANRPLSAALRALIAIAVADPDAASKVEARTDERSCDTTKTAIQAQLQRLAASGRLSQAAAALAAIE